MQKQSFLTTGINLIWGICLLLLIGCNGSANAPTKGTATATTEIMEQPTLATEPIVQSVETPTLSPEYIRFMQMVVVVMDAIPTYTPYPHAPSVEAKVLSEQRSELMLSAQRTVIAQPGWVPFYTPEATTTPDLTPFPMQPTYPAGNGFIDEDSGCGNDKLIGARNKWREHIGTRILGACAGTTYFRPYYAILLVDDYDMATHQHLSDPDIYQVPANVLWVEIADAVGERLTLKADTGEYFYFDMPTRQWVNP